MAPYSSWPRPSWPMRAGTPLPSRKEAPNGCFGLPKTRSGLRPPWRPGWKSGRRAQLWVHCAGGFDTLCRQERALPRGSSSSYYAPRSSRGEQGNVRHLLGLVERFISNLSFTCDDSSLPDKAFPYVIDPQLTTGFDAGSFDLWWTEQDCCSGPETVYPQVTAVTYYDVPGNIDSYSFDTSGFSLGWGATSGNPVCTNNNQTWADVWNNEAFYTLYLQMQYNGDGTLTPARRTLRARFT